MLLRLIHGLHVSVVHLFVLLSSISLYVCMYNDFFIHSPILTIIISLLSHRDVRISFVIYTKRFAGILNRITLNL